MEAATAGQHEVIPVSGLLHGRLIEFKDNAYEGIQELLFSMFSFQHTMPYAKRSDSAVYRAFAVTCLKPNHSFLPVELIGPRASAIIYCIRCCVFREILRTGDMNLYVLKLLMHGLTSR